MHIPSYPKVYNIGHPAIAELFQGPVLVEEKVDGSQFSFCRIGADLFMRSKGADIHAEAPEKMFTKAVESVRALSDKLHDGYVYRAEYMLSPKHNTLCYGRIPPMHLILFDISAGDTEQYRCREEKEDEAARIGLEIVPVLGSGIYSEPEPLLELLNRESILGAQRIEGVVVKNYAVLGRDKKALMGKFVREDFKERNSAEFRSANPAASDIIQLLIAEMRSEKRWEKAVFHLRERGELECSPRDIGKLIAEVKADIAAEELEHIKARLASWAMPKVLRASAAGLPEWYKRKLLESAFRVEE